MAFFDLSFTTALMVGLAAITLSFYQHWVDESHADQQIDTVLHFIRQARPPPACQPRTTTHSLTALVNVPADDQPWPTTSDPANWIVEQAAFSDRLSVRYIGTDKSIIDALGRRAGGRALYVDTKEPSKTTRYRFLRTKNGVACG